MPLMLQSARMRLPRARPGPPQRPPLAPAPAASPHQPESPPLQVATSPPAPGRAALLAPYALPRCADPGRGLAHDSAIRTACARPSPAARAPGTTGCSRPGRIATESELIQPADALVACAEAGRNSARPARTATAFRNHID